MLCCSQIIVSSLSPSLTAAGTGLGHDLMSLQCSPRTSSISRYLSAILVTGQSPIKFSDIASRSSRIILAECWYGAAEVNKLLHKLCLLSPVLIISDPAHRWPGLELCTDRLYQLYWIENRQKDKSPQQISGVPLTSLSHFLSRLAIHS